MMSVREAAAKLGIHDSRVRRLCRAGRLGKKVGTQWVIVQKDLDRYNEIGPLPRGRPKGRTKCQATTSPQKKPRN